VGARRCWFLLWLRVGVGRSRLSELTASKRRAVTEVYVRKPDFALPIKGSKVPASEAWLHEVKHDGTGSC
jgi:hypothetical protein